MFLPDAAGSSRGLKSSSLRSKLTAVASERSRSPREQPRHAAPELGALLEARPADGFPGQKRLVDRGAQVPAGVLRDFADHLARVLVPDLNPSESQHPRRLALPRGWTGSWHPTWRRELSPAPAIRTLRCIGSGRRLENG